MEMEAVMRINSTVEALADKQTVKSIIRQDAKGPVSSETLTLCHTLLRRNEWQKKRDNNKKLLFKSLCK